MNDLDDILQRPKVIDTKPELITEKTKLDLFDLKEGEEYFKDVRNNTLKQGSGFNMETLDQHFRYKQGNFVIVHGMDNVGKSSLCWWLLTLANVFAKVKTVLYCTENREQQVIKTIMQYRAGKKLDELNDLQFKEIKHWFSENFGIIRTNEKYTLDNVLDQVGEGSSKYGYLNSMIDPYNALSVPSNVNGHEYHLECANSIKRHNRINNLSTWINCHPNTEAYRNLDRDNKSKFVGHIKPPTKGHIDGGAKFPAKADEFLTAHRYTEHADRWMYTQLFVRKVKDTETGGKPTPMNKPVTLRMNANGCGFSYDKWQCPIESDDLEPKWVDPMMGYYSYGDYKAEQIQINNETGEVNLTPMAEIEHNYRNGNVFKDNKSNFEKEAKTGYELPLPEDGDFQAIETEPPF